jgi:GDP-4-dehydro-6-deoxy-D-mannose reductase
MKKVLITGITGFVGSHLMDYYLANTDYHIFGITRRRSPMNNIKHEVNNPRLTLLRGDMTDSVSINSIFRTQPFDIVHHLAAQSFVPDSWSMGEHTIDMNVKGTFNLLNSIVHNCDRDNYPTVHLAGSSEQYGLVYPNEVPITEENPFRPRSPYGVTKIATENLGYQFNQSFGLPVVVTRAFNHEGIRRGKEFSTSNFAFQIAEQLNDSDRDSKEPLVIRCGNLDAIRDFTDVRDMVDAYYKAVDYCTRVKDYDVFNIASGVGHKISEIITILSNIVGLDIEIEYEDSRKRPSDVPILIGSYARFMLATGWQPKISFEQTMRDIFNYWMEGYTSYVKNVGELK